MHASLPFRAAFAAVLFAYMPAMAAPPASGAAPGIEVDDLTRIVSLSSPRFSPDGKTVALIETRANLDEDEFRSEIVLIDVASGARRAFTQDRRHAQQPRWSPDGKALAFLAPDADKQPQVYVAPLGGGDAMRITSAKDGVQQFAWSPDSTQIAYATTDPAPDLKGQDKFHTGFYLKHDDLTVREAPRPAHIWLLKVGGDGSGGGGGGDTNAAKRLTSGTWSLPTALPPGPPASPLQWTPDGKAIIFVRQETPSSGDTAQVRLQRYDLASGRIDAVAAETSYSGYPIVSPDGQKIAFWRPRGGQGWRTQDLHLAAGPAAPSRDLSLGLDRNLFGSWWLPDSKGLIVSGNDGLTVGLWKLGLDGAATRLKLGAVMPANGFWVEADVSRGGAIAFVGQTSDNPSELYVIDTIAAAPRKLTSGNAWLANVKLGRIEAVQWKGPEGTMLDGVLTLPPAASANPGAGQKYPLALIIHGGPTSASRQRFSLAPQALAAKGFAVFEPNYRGSDNHGDTFQSAIYLDAGQGPGEDVIAGIDAMQQRSDIAAGPVFVSGWSYGGFMTTWLLGHYPDRWKAAVAGAAVTDWQQMYDLGDANVLITDQAGRSPYKGGIEAYRAQSPATLQTRIKAPTLVMSNTEDFRVPFTQSFGLYRALEDNGVETKFFVLPIRGHFPADPLRQVDVWKTWIDWLVAHRN